MTTNTNSVSDVKSTLRPEDMFISFWLDNDLLVLAGDCNGVIVEEWVQVNKLLHLIREFEDQVLQLRHYRQFIVKEFRPYCSDETSNPTRPIDEILSEIFSIILPPPIFSLLENSRYQRLVIFPDTHLHLLPFHLLTGTKFSLSKKITFSEGICYSPSGSSYAYACSKKPSKEPSLGIIVVGDSTDEEMQTEAIAVSTTMPFPNKIVSNLEELQRSSANADFLYIITHGVSSVSSDPIKISNEKGLSSLSLLFDGNSLRETDFFNERVPLKEGSIVILSACSVGQLMPGTAHEIEGLLNALFYAGASSVLAARWPIPSVTASAVFGGTITSIFEERDSISAAFAKAIRGASENQELIKLMSNSQSDIFFWGPFALYGNGL